PDAPGLVSELLVGEGDIESTQPARRLLAIATRLRSIPEAQAALAGEPAAFFTALRREPALGPVHLALEDWLTRYGDRAMNELKLEAPSLRDRPAFVVTMLRNYMAMPPFDAEAVTAAERAGRARAESRLKAALAGYPLRAWQFGVVLGWTRMHLRHRENMRFARTRLTGVVRRLFTAVGRDLAARGVFAQADDVYYLTVDELTAYVDGRSVTCDLAALAALRRAEFAGYRETEPPERFVTVGLPHRHAIAPAAAVDGPPDGALVGTPCCAGVVEGPTRLIRDPDSDMTLRGEILVAPRTDPGWVALFPAATGLLVERGSVLSHSAIVARELGLPTIVGIPGLCRRLDQGQRVRMDGATGRIEVLEGGAHGA
ncbi:MAG: PEP-utilizing enzyme, partial [Candidatus Sericytochromatia bacterium]